jgi:hypothetical protein
MGEQFVLPRPDRGGDPADTVTAVPNMLAEPVHIKRPRYGHTPTPAWPPPTAAPRAGGNSSPTQTACPLPSQRQRPRCGRLPPRDDAPDGATPRPHLGPRDHLGADTETSF